MNWTCLANIQDVFYLRNTTSGSKKTSRMIPGFFPVKTIYKKFPEFPVPDNPVLKKPLYGENYVNIRILPIVTTFSLLKYKNPRPFPDVKNTKYWTIWRTSKCSISNVYWGWCEHEHLPVCKRLFNTSAGMPTSQLQTPAMPPAKMVASMLNSVEPSGFISSWIHS